MSLVVHFCCRRVGVGYVDVRGSARDLRAVSVPSTLEGNLVRAPSG